MPLAHVLFTALVLGAAASTANSAVLDVQAICRADKDCRVKVTLGEGEGAPVVVTTFLANRVGPDMKYFKGEEYGSFDFPEAGLMYLDRPVMLDEAGTMQAPREGAPPESVLTFTTTVAVDPKGRVTFFYGFVHHPEIPLVFAIVPVGLPADDGQDGRRHRRAAIPRGFPHAAAGADPPRGRDAALPPDQRSDEPLQPDGGRAARGAP
jgi:hypothetical protein